MEGIEPPVSVLETDSLPLTDTPAKKNIAPLRDSTLYDSLTLSQVRIENYKTFGVGPSNTCGVEGLGLYHLDI